MVWESKSTEEAQSDLEMFLTHSLLKGKEETGYKLHSLHVAFLRADAGALLNEVIPLVSLSLPFILCSLLPSINHSFSIVRIAWKK